MAAPYLRPRRAHRAVLRLLLTLNLVATALSFGQLSRHRRQRRRFAAGTGPLGGQAAGGSGSSGVVEYDDFLPFPHDSLSAQDVVEACMETLQRRTEAGLEVCWNFSSDRCRAALGGSIEAFRDYATNPVFSHLVNCRGWKLVSVGPVIAGTPTRGDMQTVLVDVVSDPTDDPPRQFLWTLQRERRPPRQGCFLVHECIYVRNAYDLTL